MSLGVDALGTKYNPIFGVAEFVEIRRLLAERHQVGYEALPRNPLVRRLCLLCPKF
jgi:hypothetical protein